MNHCDSMILVNICNWFVDLDVFIRVVIRECVLGLFLLCLSLQTKLPGQFFLNDAYFIVFSKFFKQNMFSCLCHCFYMISSQTNYRILFAIFMHLMTKISWWWNDHLMHCHSQLCYSWLILRVCTYFWWYLTKLAVTMHQMIISSPTNFSHQMHKYGKQDSAIGLRWNHIETVT